MRSMLAESNCTSARESGPVEIWSAVSNGALTTPATQSAESPRRTETSPFIKEMRATPRLRSSGFCARTGVRIPADNSAAPVKAKNRMRSMAEPPELHRLYGNADAKLNFV